MQKPEVSFITLSFNHFDQLNESLKSVIQNTQDVSYEIIVTDNNSSEGDICKKIIPDKRIRLFKNDRNLGWPKAINESVEKAVGEYICVVDNDVLFLENSAKKMVDYCKRFNEDIIIGPRLLNNDLTVQVSIADIITPSRQFFQAIFFNALFPSVSSFNFEHMNYKKIEIPTEVESMMGACLFFRKSVFEKLNGFDKDLFFYSSDTDFCLRFRKAGGKVIYYPDTRVIHLGGVSSKSTVFSGFDNISLDMIKFCKKHFNLWDRILIYSFASLGLIIRIPIWLIIGIIRLDKSIIRKSYLLFIKLIFLLRGIFSD